MNSHKMSSLGRMIKHWVSYVPVPTDRRSRLLREAARLKQSRIREVNWFNELPSGSAKLQDYLYFSWPVIDGIQMRSALSI